MDPLWLPLGRFGFAGECWGPTLIPFDWKKQEDRIIMSETFNIRNKAWQASWFTEIEIVYIYSQHMTLTGLHFLKQNA